MTAYQLKFVTNLLCRGGVIAYPTEAVYGLGCDPRDPYAVFRLLDLKRRDINKGLILVASNNKQLEPYVETSQLYQENIQDSWPGPVTWLIEAAANVPRWIRGAHDSVAVRVSDHPIIRELCEHFNGALVSTSANLSGKQAFKSALLVKKNFPSIDYLIRGQLGNRTRVSEIRDAASGIIIR